MEQQQIKTELEKILALAEDTTPRDFYGEPTKDSNFESRLTASTALFNLKEGIKDLINKLDDN